MYGCSTIKDLLEILDHEEDDKLLLIGFDDWFSYRGYYDELAISPVDKPMTVKEFKDFLKSKIGEEVYGYKGGEFKINEYCSVFIAEDSGDCSRLELTPIVLFFLLGKGDDYIKKQILSVRRT